MTPSPLPTVTVTTTATATVTVTTTPPPAPPDTTSLTDQLQGWGTLAAAVVAVVGLFITIKAAKRDREDGARQREQDRKDADRRLAEEREAATANLQRQLDEQRDRDRREFLTRQLQRAGELYAEFKGTSPANTPLSAALHTPWVRPDARLVVHLLRAHLATIPSPYASLLKTQAYEPADRPYFVDEETQREAFRRSDEDEDEGDGTGPVSDEAIFKEIADNIDEILGRRGASGG